MKPCIPSRAAAPRAARARRLDPRAIRAALAATGIILTAAAGLMAGRGEARAADTGLVLRDAPAASGPLVRVGDLFETDAQTGARVLAQAPAPGQTVSFGADVLQARLAAMGLHWPNAAAVRRVDVLGPPAADVSGSVPRASASVEPGVARRGLEASMPAAARPRDLVRRGDMVILVHEAGPLRVSLRARAVSDPDADGLFRALNPDSGRVIEALAEGPGRGRAIGPVAGPAAGHSQRSGRQ